MLTLVATEITTLSVELGVAAIRDRQRDTRKSHVNGCELATSCSCVLHKEKQGGVCHFEMIKLSFEVKRIA